MNRTPLSTGGSTTLLALFAAGIVRSPIASPAADLLGISQSTLERLTKAGELPRIKHGTKVLDRVTVLEAWLERHEAADEAGAA